MTPEQIARIAESIRPKPTWMRKLADKVVPPYRRFGPAGWFGVGMIAAIAIWLYWGTIAVLSFALYWRDKLNASNEPKLTVAELGQIGDIFGGVNALFASFAFIGVAFAAFYQRKTFLQQLKDSAANAYSLKLANETNAAQLRTATQEVFNGLFFKVLGEVQRMSEQPALELGSEGGRAAVRTKDVHIEVARFLEELVRKYDMTDRSNTESAEARSLIQLELLHYYSALYEVNSVSLAPLFRNMFHAFDLISKTKMTYEEQCNYSKIARASFNDDLLRLLMLNGLSDWGEGFKPLIEKYGLLKHLDNRLDGHGTEGVIAGLFYDSCAFHEFDYRRCCYDSATGKRLTEIECEENLMHYLRQDDPDFQSWQQN